MGAECSVERNIVMTEGKEQRENTNETSWDMNNMNSFEFKNYKEYQYKMDIFKMKVKEILKKVEINNEFIYQRDSHNALEKIENSYYMNIEQVRMEKLYEVNQYLFIFF